MAPEIAKNIGMAIRPVREWRLRRPRTTGQAFARRDEQLERYAFVGLRFLLRHSKTVEGVDIAEFGPGDNLVSGLAMLAAGARSYVALDRFVADYSGAQAKQWYRGVEERWPTFFPDLSWPDWLRADSFPEAYSDRVEAIATSIEEADLERRFDIVCSYQVGEHVTDVSRFASLTGSLLAPDGLAIHRVDFGPHDCWTRYDDPLTFLRFSPRLWSAMGSNRGYPNRIRHHEFLRAFAEAGLEVEFGERNSYAAQSVRIDLFHERFRKMPVDSLLTGDVVYVCRRIRAELSPYPGGGSESYR